MSQTENLTERRTYTVDEAARIMGVSRSAAYEYAREGLIPIVRVGGRFLVPRVQFDRFIAGELKNPAA